MRGLSWLACSRGRLASCNAFTLLLLNTPQRRRCSLARTTGGDARRDAGRRRERALRAERPRRLRRALLARRARGRPDGDPRAPAPVRGAGGCGRCSERRLLAPGAARGAVAGRAQREDPQVRVGGPELCGRWWRSCRARKAHAAVLCELARLGDGRHRASAQGAFDAFAMGNYPYASHYIGGSVEHPLPAWPMRAACAFMAEPRLSEDALLQARWKVTAPSCGWDP